MKKILVPIVILSLFAMIHFKGMHMHNITFIEHRLRLNLQEGDPPTVHPLKGIDLRSRCLLLALYEPLMRRTPGGTLEFAAAESVDIDSTGTIYTFHMRPHVWSNGEPVTSYHFEQSWKLALEPQFPCAKAELFYPIKNALAVKQGKLPPQAVGISTPDDRTLVVELENPTAYFLDLTATSFFAPLYEASSSEPTCYNGPFILGKWVHGQILQFLRNPSYWDVHSVELEEVQFAMVTEPMTALSMYNRGEIDVVGDPCSPLPFEAIPSLTDQGQLYNKLVSRIFYLLLNNNTFPMNNRALRKALALSLDRDLLTQHLCIGEIPSTSLLPEPLSLIDEHRVIYDDKLALTFLEQGLQELGLTRSTCPPLVFHYANLSGQKKIAEFIQEQWQTKLGIKVEIVCSDWNTHIGNLRKKNYQIGGLHLTTVYQDPMFYFDFFRDKASLTNYSGWENEDFRALLSQAERAADPQKRRHLLQQAELLLLEEMPVIPIFTQTLHYLARKNIRLEISDLGIYDFKRTSA